MIRKNSVILALCLFAFPLFSQASEPYYMRNFSADELIHEALKASGVEEDSEEEILYIDKISRLKDAYLSFISGKEADEIAETSLPFLYENTLTAYSSRQTRIDELLDTGKYNCVSSTIMYLYLMKLSNIPCTAIQTTEHSFCEVTIDGNIIRVETTNPLGYNPGTRKESGIPNQYYKVPAKFYANKKTASDPKAVSLIYSNRISDLFKKNKNLEAMELAQKNFILMGECKDSIEVLQSCAVNVLNEFGSVKNYQKGLEYGKLYFNDFGLSRQGIYNYESLIQFKLYELESAGLYDEIFTWLPEEEKIIGRQKVSDLEKKTLQNKENKEIAIIHNTFVPLFNGRSYKDARAVIFQGLYDHPESQILQTDYKNCVQNELHEIYTISGYDKALEFLESEEVIAGLSEKNRTTFISQLKKQEATEYHNRATPLVNSKDYEGARLILQEGIDKLGPEKLLVNDLNRLKNF